MIRSRRLWLIVAGAALPLFATGLLTQAAPKSGESPPGKVYFVRYSPDFAAYSYWTMLGNGSEKSEVPSFPYAGEPNRKPNLNGAWFLSAQVVEGSYPNGAPRYELHATNELTGESVQLTENPRIQHFTIPTASRWSHDDSFISFAAVTWTPVELGGNFTDPLGQRWQVESGVYVASLVWLDGAPLAGSPIKVLSGGLYWESTGAQETFYARPDIASLDWSPSKDQLVFERIAQDLVTGREWHDLFVVSFGTDGEEPFTISLGPGRTPEWSPVASRIAYWRHDAVASNIWVVDPDGSNGVQLTSGGTGGPDSRPRWAPNGGHLAFTRSFHNRRRGSQGPYTVTTNAVMRVPATGGSVVNLTNDLDGNNADAVAWR